MLVYLGVAWSAIRALLGVAYLTGWARITIEFAGEPIANYLGSWFIITIVQIVFFFLFAIAILFGWNWGRLGFLIMSFLVAIWTIIRGPIGPGTYRALYPTAAFFIASWLFNQPKVLEFFNSSDLRPNWLSRDIRGIHFDLAIGVGLLIVGLIVEVVGGVLFMVSWFN